MQSEGKYKLEIMKSEDCRKLIKLMQIIHFIPNYAYIIDNYK